MKAFFLIKRIKNMSFKNLFKTVNDVHKINKKCKLFIFLDIVYCGVKYQAGYVDYKLFEMYNLNRKQRKTIVTRGINNQLVKKYNNKDYIKYFSDKALFNKKFNKYLNRDWMLVNEDNYEEFRNFALEHEEIIIKPLSESCGKGIEKIKVNKNKVKSIYENLLSTKRYLVEEVCKQCDSINKLHPYSINTIRLVTLNDTIVAAFLRIGTNKQPVDNFNHGGIVAPINIETGIVDYLAIDKQGNVYERHPLTNEKILWFQIPKWPRVKRFVLQACKEIPELKYVGWDICVSDKGPLIIEGNEYPGHDLYQLPVHRTDGIGLLPRFKDAINKKGNDLNEDSNSN